MQGMLVGVGFLAMTAYGIVSIWASYLGLSYELGTGWAVGITIASLMFRFSLPLVVGAFLGAMYVWHWHWALALLFAAPGIAFMIPGVIAAIIAAIPRRRTS